MTAVKALQERVTVQRGVVAGETASISTRNPYFLRLLFPLKLHLL